MNCHNTAIKDYSHCEAQEVFDKCEVGSKCETRHFHLEQAKCLFYLIGQCDIILQQLDSLIDISKH